MLEANEGGGDVRFIVDVGAVAEGRHPQLMPAGGYLLALVRKHQPHVNDGRTTTLVRAFGAKVGAGPEGLRVGRQPRARLFFFVSFSHRA